MANEQDQPQGQPQDQPEGQLQWESPSSASSSSSSGTPEYASGASYSPCKGRRKRTEEEEDPSFNPRDELPASKKRRVKEVQAERAATAPSTSSSEQQPPLRPRPPLQANQRETSRSGEGETMGGPRRSMRSWSFKSWGRRASHCCPLKLPRSTARKYPV